MKEIQEQMQIQFAKMYATGKLFVSGVNGSELWDIYLDKMNTNSKWRDPESSVYNCNTCNAFFRRYANIVALNEDLEIMTIFDIVGDEEHKTAFEVLSSTIKAHNIIDVFCESRRELEDLKYGRTSTLFNLGLPQNFKEYSQEELDKFSTKFVDLSTSKTYTFNHFYLTIPVGFLLENNTVETNKAAYRDYKNVFLRGMSEISLETLELVLDLMDMDSILDGATHREKLVSVIEKKKLFDLVPDKDKDKWAWVHSNNYKYAKFRNEVLGTLLVDLSKGAELEEAIKSWNKKVDPINFMRATAPITKKQIEDAKKFVEENEYTESFDRRLATIDDIHISQILHVNSGNSAIKVKSLFDGVTASKPESFKLPLNIPIISIGKFMEDLSSYESVEAYLENKLVNNLVTLTTSKNRESKNIFKWDNNFSWTFIGNLTGKSQIKEAVKGRGGKTDAPVRLSMAFPNTTYDYDLHVYEPNNDHISYSNRRQMQKSSGMLDLDAQGVDGHQLPEKRVENITYSDIHSMPNGAYLVSVNNYSRTGLNTKFNLEIEINGEITLYESKSNTINTLTVGKLLKSDTGVVFMPEDLTLLESKSGIKDVWGLSTNHFHKVNLISVSPNHWTNDVGNKHYMFMLQDCKVTENIRGFHSENLKPEIAAHRKVLEALSYTTKIEASDTPQLSGLGFNATVRDNLVVKVSVEGKSKLLNIQF